jgi:transposase
MESGSKRMSTRCRNRRRVRRQAIESASAELRYLPPYSTDHKREKHPRFRQTLIEGWH